MTASGRLAGVGAYGAPTAEDTRHVATGPALESPRAGAEAALAVKAEGAVGTDLRALFERNYADVWRLLRRFGVPEADLDDQAQEVFWVAARKLSELQTGRERAFLYGVALRVASNAMRRLKASPLTRDARAGQFEDFIDPRPSPEDQLNQRQARVLLDAVLDRMPLELRSVFVLFELEGLPVAEIAELENIPLGTASSRLRRAREEFAGASKRLQAALSKTDRSAR